MERDTTRRSLLRVVAAGGAAALAGCGGLAGREPVPSADTPPEIATERVSVEQDASVDLFVAVRRTTRLKVWSEEMPDEAFRVAEATATPEPATESEAETVWHWDVPETATLTIPVETRWLDPGTYRYAVDARNTAGVVSVTPTIEVAE